MEVNSVNEFVKKLLPVPENPALFICCYLLLLFGLGKYS